MQNAGALPWAGKIKPLAFSDEIEPDDDDDMDEYDEHQIPPQDHMDNWEAFANVSVIICNFWSLLTLTMSVIVDDQYPWISVSFFFAHSPLTLKAQLKHSSLCFQASLPSQFASSDHKPTPTHEKVFPVFQ